MQHSSGVAGPWGPETAARSAPAALSTSDERLLELYDRTSCLVYGLLLRILRDACKAQDLLVQLYREAATTILPADEAHAQGWLLARARTLALAYRCTAEDSGVAPTGSANVISLATGGPSCGETANATARTALAQLQPMDRRILELAYFGGQSPRAIAGCVGLAENRVKARLRAALHTFAHLRGLANKEAAS